jgi:uracil phosphoribosyltransferase
MSKIAAINEAKDDDMDAEEIRIFRAIAIPSSLRTVAPFLDEAQAHAGYDCICLLLL